MCVTPFFVVDELMKNNLPLFYHIRPNFKKAKNNHKSVYMYFKLLQLKKQKGRAIRISCKTAINDCMIKLI